METLIMEASVRDLRGYIIAGELDTTITQDNLPILVDKLVENGISCQLEIVPGAGHEFSPEYEPVLLRALEFITG
jgi:dipeptidyl aminopeptidase/acylaminoacyl peptidase